MLTIVSEKQWREEKHLVRVESIELCKCSGKVGMHGWHNCLMRFKEIKNVEWTENKNYVLRLQE